MGSASFGSVAFGQYAPTGTSPIYQVLRPDGTDTAGSWTAQPSGTLHGVVSDDVLTTFARKTP